MSAVKPSYGDLPRDFEPGVNLDVRERISRRRWSPRRNRSARVAEIDQTVARLEMRQLELDAELRELQERRVNAPGEHAVRLSTWELAGRKGPRPDPTVAALDEQIRDCQAEIDGVLLAISQTLEQKAAFIEKHRGRLVKEAEAEVAAARERLVGLLDSIAPARQELIEAREALAWFATFPDSVPGETPEANLLGGGLLRVSEVLGVRHQLRHRDVLTALARDAEWLSAKPAERGSRAGNAMWADLDEGRQELRQERQALLRAQEGEPA